MLALKLQRLRAWSPALANTPLTDPSSDFFFSATERYQLTQSSVSQARRLSHLTKISADLGLKICAGEKMDHVVFSSRHGELTNATQILTMIGKTEIISPTLFSQSVHNTAIGTLALFQKNHAATTALAAGANGFVMGLVSCAAYLQENPAKQVLYIAADDLIPDTFANCLTEANVPYATAMILSLKSGKELQIEGLQKAISLETSNAVPQGIKFLKWFFTENSRERHSPGH